MQGKFIIADIAPCLWGGAFIYFSFYDYPDKVFAAMVYSDMLLPLFKQVRINS